MHPMNRNVLIAAAFAIFAAPALLRGQEGRATPTVAALNAVIDYRVNWIRDSTTFDACSVYRTIGSPEQVSAGLLAAFRSRLSTPTSPCGSRETLDPRREMRVLVDSVNAFGSTGRVVVTVRQGEQTHREEYWLVNPTPGETWAVDRVVLYGAIRTYYRAPATPRR
jgi:hypothetical protein